MIPHKLVSDWMTFIRENPNHAHRFSECFYPSQMISKHYALDLLQESMGNWGEIYERQIFVFGGWYGVFAQLLTHRFRAIKVYNIDVDPECEKVFNLLPVNNREGIKHITADMAKFEYHVTPDFVINTSTEHVTQETYDAWWNNVPKGTKYLIQSNNFFESDEHIRCANSLDEFVEMNNLQSANYKSSVEVGERPDGSTFFRFMALGER